MAEYDISRIIEIVLGSLVVAFATISLGATIFKRCYGIRNFGSWGDGNSVSFTEKLALLLFMGFIGASFLSHSTLWIIPAVIAFFVLFILQKFVNFRHADEEESLRRENRTDHPVILSVLPPESFDTIASQQLVDANTCLNGGDKPDTQSVADAFDGTPPEGASDLFVIQESSELISGFQITSELAMPLSDAFKPHNNLGVRMPDAKELDDGKEGLESKRRHS